MTPILLAGEGMHDYVLAMTVSAMRISISTLRVSLTIERGYGNGIWNLPSTRKRPSTQEGARSAPLAQTPTPPPIHSRWLLVCERHTADSPVFQSRCLELAHDLTVATDIPELQAMGAPYGLFHLVEKRLTTVATSSYAITRSLSETAAISPLPMEDQRSLRTSMIAAFQTQSPVHQVGRRYPSQDT